MNLQNKYFTLRKGHIIKDDLVIVIRRSLMGNNRIVPEEYEA